MHPLRLLGILLALGFIDANIIAVLNEMHVQKKAARIAKDVKKPARPEGLLGIRHETSHAKQLREKALQLKRGADQHDGRWKSSSRRGGYSHLVETLLFLTMFAGKHPLRVLINLKV